MKNIFTSLKLACIICFFEATMLHAQTPLTIQWNKTYGGTGYDYGNAVAKTPDGGILAVGSVGSNNGDITNPLGEQDIWLTKLDANGNLEWQKTIGGSSIDGDLGDGGVTLEKYGTDVAVSADGTIYVVGTTNSTDIDAVGNHGAYDILVVKLDHNGNVLKHHCFGGSNYDWGNAIALTQGGTLLVAGGTTSKDGDDSTDTDTYPSWWVLNLNDTLGIIWQKFPGDFNNYFWPKALDIQPASDGGSFVTGYISDRDSPHGVNSDVWTIKLDSNGNLVWQQALGGSDFDDGKSVLPTSDGGCLVAATTQSCDFDVTDHKGGCGNNLPDIWLIKFDAQGNVFWKKTFGGTNNEFAGGLLETPDHNYLSVGRTNSNDGDVSGQHGYEDYWITKVDPLGNLIYQQCIGTVVDPYGEGGTSCVLLDDGSFVFNGAENVESPYEVLDYGIIRAYETPPPADPILPWTATLGGSSADQAYDGEPTSDDGAIICGTTTTDQNGDVGCANGGFPTQWVAKVDAHGVFQFGECITGGIAYSTQQTSDGGYVYTGPGYLPGGSWGVVKFNIDSIQWANGYGGDGYTPYSIQQINDGGYILAGVKHWATPPDTLITDHKGTEFCVMKLDAAGTFLWEKFYGGTLGETAYSIDQTLDNGFIVAGSTSSSNGNVTNLHGKTDAWVIKIDANGNLQWQKTIGGTKSDQANWVRHTTDGGYIVACQTNSKDGDAVGNHGGYDFLIVKLNSAGSIVWKKLLGGSADDKVHSVCQLSDGGYMAVGETYSTDKDVSGNHGQSDYWVVKLDANGNLVWQHCFGGTGIDVAQSVSPAPDGKVIVSGRTQSTDGDVIGNHGNYDYWILKFIDGNQVFYQDADGDGYGNPAVNFTGFFPPAGYVYNNLDCNDANANVHPGVLLDPCNGLDDDCDGVIDENGTYVRYFKDADGDGYGNTDSLKWSCSTLAGYVTDNTDCNDANASVHPGACEIYFNGVDEDCSGVADDCNAPSSGFSTTKIQATSAKVKWNTLPCAVGYTVQYRIIGTIDWSSVNVSSNTGSKKLSSLTPQSNYEWQVRTKCHSMPNVFSDYSALQNFTTASSRDAEAMGDMNDVYVTAFPNPAGNFLIVQCDDWSGEAMITIYSVLGEVMMQKLSTASTNSLNETLDVSKLSSGCYIIVVENNFDVGQIKFVKE